MLTNEHCPTILKLYLVSRSRSESMDYASTWSKLQFHEGTILADVINSMYV